MKRSARCWAYLASEGPGSMDFCRPWGDHYCDKGNMVVFMISIQLCSSSLWGKMSTCTIYLCFVSLRPFMYYYYKWVWRDLFVPFSLCTTINRIELLSWWCSCRLVRTGLWSSDLNPSQPLPYSPLSQIKCRSVAELESRSYRDYNVFYQILGGDDGCHIIARAQHSQPYRRRLL